MLRLTDGFVRRLMPPAPCRAVFFAAAVKPATLCGALFGTPNLLLIEAFVNP